MSRPCSQLQRFVVSTFTVLHLGACVSFQSKPLSADRSANAFTERSLSDIGLRDFLSKLDAMLQAQEAAGLQEAALQLPLRSL